MNKYLPLVVAVILTIGATYVQGLYSHRWFEKTRSEQITEFQQRLVKVPMVIGDKDQWQGEVLENTDVRMQQVAGIMGQVERSYTNYGGQAVTMSLVCGDRYDMSTHNPDACYAAAGFTMDLEGDRISTVKYESLAGEPREVKLVTAQFKKEDPSGTQKVRVFWVWNANGKWEAPANDPRIGLSSENAWFKLYLIAPELQRSQIGIDETPTTANPAYQLAVDLLPVLDEVLFPTESTSSESAPVEQDTAAADPIAA